MVNGKSLQAGYHTVQLSAMSRDVPINVNIVTSKHISKSAITKSNINGSLGKAIVNSRCLEFKRQKMEIKVPVHVHETEKSAKNAARVEISTENMSSSSQSNCLQLPTDVAGNIKVMHSLLKDIP